MSDWIDNEEMLRKAARIAELEAVVTEAAGQLNESALRIAELEATLLWLVDPSTIREAMQNAMVPVGAATRASYSDRVATWLLNELNRRALGDNDE